MLYGSQKPTSIGLLIVLGAGLPSGSGSFRGSCRPSPTQRPEIDSRWDCDDWGRGTRTGGVSCRFFSLTDADLCTPTSVIRTSATGAARA